MHGWILLLVGAAMLATLGVLAAGLIGMVRKAPNAAAAGARSNRLMQYRVVFQAVALALFALAMFLARK